jgi:hypothetical protein
MLFSAALSRTAVDMPSEARELLLVDPSDGSDLLFEVLSSTVEDPREGTGIVSVLRNITDLRRATEQIEENYQRLRVLEAAARGRARSPEPDHRFGRGSDHRHRPGGETVMMNAPAEELFTVIVGAPSSAPALRPGERRALLVVHLRACCSARAVRRGRARRDRPDEPEYRDRSRGGDCRQGDDRHRRVDGGRHDPARPPRGARRARCSSS